MGKTLGWVVFIEKLARLKMSWANNNFEATPSIVQVLGQTKAVTSHAEWSVVVTLKDILEYRFQGAGKDKG